MKTIKKIYTLMAAAVVLTMSSCIDETFPQSSTATADQVASMSSALEGTLNGIPSQMVQGYLVYGEQEHETDMGYPQFMMAQTELLGDIYPGGSNPGYDWFRNYNTLNASFGDNSYFSYLPWYTLYKFVKQANSVLQIIDEESEMTDDQKCAAGVAYAARAFDYYMLMVFFEPVENKYTDCSSVLGLTVPIVTENTTEEEAKNNPRVTHDELVKFILSDLDKAESYLSEVEPDNPHLPNLAVTYGIRAKVLMWDKQYAEAATYARKAIDESGAVPMSADEWENPSSGFAVATSAWMWYLTYAPEEMGNLCNYAGWASAEADWGYSSLTCPMIDASLYNKIAPTDIRKRVFLNPNKYDYYNYQTSRDRTFIEEAPDYLALKFRCRSGNWADYSVGGATDVPIMRVEEMYLLEAEAVGASQGVAAGLDLLNAFMVKYRQSNYNYTTTDLREFQLEVLTQERIEFWGEGNAFPNAKRLRPGVMQNYSGTNAPANIFKINCQDIKPNWNFVIPRSEYQNNKALEGKNNPDPTQAVVGPTTPGEYAKSKAEIAAEQAANEGNE